jgi:hypothetical protein
MQDNYSHSLGSMTQIEINQNKLLNTNWVACRKNKIEMRGYDPVAFCQNWHRDFIWH